MADFDETFDWVVVGSGAGSVSSALLMKHAGKSVVILEKSDKFGGTTAAIFPSVLSITSSSRSTHIRPVSG